MFLKTLHAFKVELIASEDTRGKSILENTATPEILFLGRLWNLCLHVELLLESLVTKTGSTINGSVKVLTEA